MKIHRNGFNDYSVYFQNCHGDDVLAWLTFSDGGLWFVEVNLRNDDDGSFDRLALRVDYPSLEECLDEIFVLQTSKVFPWYSI